MDKYSDILGQDSIHEECGVFGIYDIGDNLDVSHMTYYGLFALQHRGQESCGIAVNNVDENNEIEIVVDDEEPEIVVIPDDEEAIDETVLDEAEEVEVSEETGAVEEVKAAEENAEETAE